MKKITLSATLAAGLAIFAGSASAQVDLDAVLNVEGMDITTRAPAADFLDIDEVISGWVYRTKETQALQMDDFENPGMIFVDIAMDDWNTVDGSEGKSCASCHTDGPAEFAGLRAEMPRWNEEKGSLFNMEDYINLMRVEYMGAEPLKWAKPRMDAMVALISLQSRGDTINVAIDGPVSDIWEQGQELYFTRVGQLDMSCANCHEDSYGLMIRADRLSQGQSNGFPTYRLKNAKLNSIQARFKGCMSNIRAEPYAIGSEEFRALELYVASRGNGLSVEGPSVRN
ncbi:MAG: sulfur oxidation c-type cytochrome SoxA [Rhodobacteraceae bacterium]|nr:sulfur oxidation c-type cytochrome SoxA [Paracoccaceae bacterium]